MPPGKAENPNHNPSDEGGFRTDPNRWIRVTRVIVVLAFIGLGVRLYDIQVREHAEHASTRIDQMTAQRKVPVPRGDIKDRKGRVIARDQMKISVFADPVMVRDPDQVVDRLNEYLDFDRKQLLQDLQRTDDRFVWVERFINPDRADHIRDLSMEGIGIRREFKRTYPYGAIAPETIGYVGEDREGLEGIEYVKNETLSGESGTYKYLRDGLGARRFRPERARKGKKPSPGDDVRLTLDVRVQQYTRQALQDVMDSYQPEWAAGVVMDLENGEILAIANLPSFDPSKFEETPKAVRQNRVIRDPVEPGSVFKPVVMSAALEEEVVSPDTMFYCENGAFHYRGRLLHDWRSFGELSARQILVQSSNIGMAKIGLRLEDKLRPWLIRFGFGRQTGLNLPGEDAGFVQTSENWNPIYTQTSVPMGHEIMVTPLQMTRAIGLIARGGRSLSPTLFPDEKRASGTEEDVPGDRIVSREVARTVQGMMRDVVEEGTGRRAASDVISIAGKTGTAEHYDEENAYLSGFVGTAPHDDPSIAVGVFVQRPQGPNNTGGFVAAPAVGDIIEQTALYMDLTSDE